MPGRTPRQCAEHYIFLASRHVRDMASVWQRDVELKLLEVRAKHCVGTRSPNWVAVARDVSEAAGVQLTVEDCKRKSKLLVRRLHFAGLPERASVEGQFRFASENPDALMTVEDKRRLKLQEWAAERGLSIRPAAPPPHRGAPGGPPAPAPAGDPPELLRQSRFLRVLAGLRATPGGLEVEDDMPAAEMAEPDPDAVAAEEAVGAGDCGDDPSDHAPTPIALPHVQPDAHPVAAAVVTLLHVRKAGSAAAAPADPAAEGAQRDDQTDAAAPRGGTGGAGDGAAAAGSAPVDAESGVPGCVERAWAMQVNGAMLEGRWLQDVRTCAERRRARIRSLHERGLLRVRRHMPQWRQELAAAAAAPPRPPRVRKPKQPRTDPVGLLQLENDGGASAAGSEGAAGVTAVPGVPSCAAGVLVERAGLNWGTQEEPDAAPAEAPPMKRRRAPKAGRATNSLPNMANSGAEDRAGAPKACAAATVAAESPSRGSKVAQQAAVAQAPSNAEAAQAARSPFAGDVQVLAACAQSHASAGSRRSVRKRKLTSKLLPDS